MTMKTVMIAGLMAVAFAACSPTAETNGNGSAVKAQAVETKAADPVEVADLSAAIAGQYDIEKTHAYITFSYVHQGYSKPLLRWRNWDSQLNWNPENPEESSVSVEIQVADIDSGVDIFDDHLRSDSWFDAAAHPTITFQSTSLSGKSGNTGTMTGDLTIKDITKPVTLDVTFNKAGFSQRSNSYKLGFSATGQVKRSDWGLGNYAPSVSDTVDLIIETEYVMKSE